MAIVQNRVSDFTSQPVANLARVSLTVGDEVWTADADSSEDLVTVIQTVGRKTAKRGRKPTAEVKTRRK